RRVLFRSDVVIVPIGGGGLASGVALALAAGRRVTGRRKCAVVSGGNIDAATLAQLLSEVRPRPPRKPRRRSRGPEPAAAAGDGAARKPIPVAKRRPAANLSPTTTVSVPMAPIAPQPVEEEFTW